jgi:predicted transcriptional regulator
MFKAALDSGSFRFINKKQLANLKTKAIRSGVWFKVLQRIDRVLFDLTIRVVDNIRSVQLAKSIIELTRKLENGMKGGFSRSLVEIGLPLAQKLSRAAQRMGNISAKDWEIDFSFVRFLAIQEINNGKMPKR